MGRPHVRLAGLGAGILSKTDTILGGFNNLLFGPEVAYIQCF